MPDSPDFDLIALDIAARAGRDDILPHIKDGLRLIWNARGAADIAKLDTELSMMMGATMAGPYVKNLDRALRGLDRV